MVSLPMISVPNFATEREELRLAQKVNGNYKEEAERLEKELSALCMGRAEGALNFTVSCILCLENETLALGATLTLFSDYRQ